MKLLTKALLQQIPPVNSQAEIKDPMVVCKFFMPDGSWTWYVIEGSTREREGCGFGVEWAVVDRYMVNKIRSSWWLRANLFHVIRCT